MFRIWLVSTLCLLYLSTCQADSATNEKKEDGSKPSGPQHSIIHTPLNNFNHRTHETHRNRNPNGISPVISSDGSTMSYRIRLPDGRYQIVTYAADELGYLARITYEDPSVTAGALSSFGDNSLQRINPSRNRNIINRHNGHVNPHTSFAFQNDLHSPVTQNLHNDRRFFDRSFERRIPFQPTLIRHPSLQFESTDQLFPFQIRNSRNNFDNSAHRFEPLHGFSRNFQSQLSPVDDFEPTFARPLPVGANSGNSFRPTSTIPRLPLPAPENGDFFESPLENRFLSGGRNFGQPPRGASNFNIPRLPIQTSATINSRRNLNSQTSNGIRIRPFSSRTSGPARGRSPIQATVSPRPAILTPTPVPAEK